MNRVQNLTLCEDTTKRERRAWAGGKWRCVLLELCKDACGMRNTKSIEFAVAWEYEMLLVHMEIAEWKEITKLSSELSMNEREMRNTRG